MDNRSFDTFVKAVASGVNRRTLLKGLLGLGGTAVGASQFGEAHAARRPTPTPKPAKCPGVQVPVNGVCTCPGSAPDKCGPDCCNPAGIGASHSECCDNACCYGVCYGEELCCPYPRVHCPADHVSRDLCCDEGSLCCGEGTATPFCVPDLPGACCADSDCPQVGTACGACVDNLCTVLPCGACQACSNGECVGCELAGYGCCNSDDACVECCLSEQCGPYFDCDLYICEPCEVEGRVPCGEPPCIEGPGSRANCCCEACNSNADCPSCHACFDGACRRCDEMGLECYSGVCGECGSSEDCGPYFDCDLYTCLTCEEAGMASCGSAPCPSWSFNCCCDACAQDSECDYCEACSQGACVPCSYLGLKCAGDSGCGECTSSEECGPYYDCDLYICLTCEEAGMVPCGEPPCTGPDAGNNCCCPI